MATRIRSLAGLLSALALSACAGGPLTRPPPLDRVLQLDGVNGYVEVPYSMGLDISDSVTIEAWFSVVSFPVCSDPADIQPYCTYAPIISQPTPTSGIGNYLLAVAQDAIVFGFEPTTGSDVRMHAHVQVTPGWHHVAVSHEYGRPDGTRVFLDGVAVAAEWVAGNGDEPAHPNAGTPYLIGRLGVPRGYFHGMIDDVRIWRVTRTPEEIRATMYVGLSGHEAGLAAYWKLDDSADSRIAVDASGNQNVGDVLGGATPGYNNTARPKTRGAS